MCYIHLSSFQHLALGLVHGMFSEMFIPWISGHKNAPKLYRQEVGGNPLLRESAGGIGEVM